VLFAIFAVDISRKKEIVVVFLNPITTNKKKEPLNKRLTL